MDPPFPPGQSDPPRRSRGFSFTLSSSPLPIPLLSRRVCHQSRSLQDPMPRLING